MSISIMKDSAGTTHDIIAGGITYATCGTAAETAAKAATVSAGVFNLFTGAKVTIKFTYANTVANPTLNVANTGAKAIYWHGAALASSQYWAAGAVLDFVYDGSYWNLVGVAKDNNTTYTIPTSLKNPNKLTIKGAGTSVEAYDGSAVGEVDIVAGNNVTVTAADGKITVAATDTNTTYTFATGDNNGQIKVTPSGGSAQNVSVKGLGSAAYTDSSAYAAASHGTHLTIGTTATTAAAGNHTHNYAGSSSAGGAANSVKTNLTIKLNSGTTEGTNLFTFNGSTAKSIDITPASIGAAAASHGTHLTIGTTATTAAAGNHTHSGYVPTSRTINGKALSSNISLTASDVGAAAASHGTHLTIGTTATTAAAGNHTHSGYAPAYTYSTTDLTAGSSSLTTGKLYFVYE